MNIAQALGLAKAEGVDLLDAELLLEEVLSVKRAFILAHPEENLDSPQEKKYVAWIERRADNEPLAYILGYKEFFGINFLVTKDVLVPRPETEELVEWVLNRVQNNAQLNILDIGTGSGAIACTLALKLPQSEITACDISEKVLDCARNNAKELGMNNISFIKSNLLTNIQNARPFDVVVANLPYLDAAWEKDASTKHEPAKALYAENNGLALYEELLAHLPERIHHDSFGIFECDPRNASELQKLVTKALPHNHVSLLQDHASRNRFVTFEKKR